MKRPPNSTLITGSNRATGYWVPYVIPKTTIPPGKPWRVPISLVRNVPTKVSSVSSTDPFGPSLATLEFPAITLLDEPGEGDLWWLVGEANVDIHWYDVATSQSIYIWEGTLQSFDWNEGESGSGSLLTVTCQGAMLQMDNYLAVPKYPYQPIPYEIEIANQFKGRPSQRLGWMFTEWPSWWRTTYNKAYWDKQPLYRRPVGMSNGQRWTGLLTRATGNFEPTLQHINNLLGSMFTDRGQWTLMLDPGRRPVLRHRDRVDTARSGTLMVDLLHPGVKFTNMTQDHSQKVNAVYANGTTVKGVTFNGMRVSPDGTRTWYEPYSARREVEPAVTANRWLTPGIMRREVNISFSEGGSEDEARIVAERHLARYADAGLTGTLSLSIDPILLGTGTGTYPRQLVRAGQNIQVRNVFGRPNGVLFHISESTSTDDATTLTLDSKYRDQLTVQEVRARGRDALTPTRLLSINAYQPTQKDLLFPWSYALGSGYVPRGSQSLFAGMPQDIEFPWESWTRSRPPRNSVWRQDYMRIGPTSRVADNNWARHPTSTSKSFKAFRVRMSQAGSAKLFQIAAYDRNGNVMKVPFHVALYTNNAVSVTSMPYLTAANAPRHPPYRANHRYPFFAGAFEETDDNGKLNDQYTRNLKPAGLVAGWGNYYERAGYWPGTSSATGSLPTGLLSLNNPFTWTLENTAGRVNLQRTPEENLRNDNAGVADLYVMIYCDAQAAREVFFLGRIFRNENPTD